MTTIKSPPDLPDDSDASIDLRRAPRVHVNREFASIDAFLSEYVTNISESGVFIRTDTPLAIGTRVNLKFSIILDEVETIEGIGEVVRVTESPEGYRGMGVVFVQLDSFSQLIIERLLTRKMIKS
jgi:uncharacterized protein (TIGR02266 family)